MNIKRWVESLVDSVDVDVDKTINLTKNTRLRIKIYTEKVELGNKYIITPNESYYENEHLSRKIKCNQNNINVNILGTTSSDI